MTRTEPGGAGSPGNVLVGCALREAAFPPLHTHTHTYTRTRESLKHRDISSAFLLPPAVGFQSTSAQTQGCTVQRVLSALSQLCKVDFVFSLLVDTCTNAYTLLISEVCCLTSLAGGGRTAEGRA